MKTRAPSSGGTKLNKKRSAVVRRTSRRISFSPRKNVTSTAVNKKQKQNTFTNPEEGTVKEENVLPNGKMSHLNGEVSHLNGEMSHTLFEKRSPKLEVQEATGESVTTAVSKLKFFFQFLFFFVLLFTLFDEFFNPLSELFCSWGDEFYQTLIFLTTPSLQLLH